ncbi:MAG TPA: LamB/YcsF family protein, partial [Coprothermobacter sp.]|nr:LamB/YcsF family protein [Coprothermobacter sp.]
DDPLQATERALRMVLEGKVTAINGKEVPIVAHSICVHGDNPKAVQLASSIRKELEKAHVEVVELTKVLEVA